MSEYPTFTSPPPLDTQNRPSPPRKWATQVWIHITRHIGVGVICSVAYFDPGSWGVDLQAGSDFGYKLLFIILLAGIFAVVIQSLACKLGVVTGLDLAAHCRLLLHNRSKYTMLCRWGILYPLYILTEIAIIGTDLSELVGSAIALNLIFPKLPLWAGVLLTTFDVLLILAFSDPLRGRPVRSFELIIGILVFAVLICLCILISRVPVQWGEAFKGYLPSNVVLQHGGLYTSVGILGATVMPHGLFIGSALATQDRAAIKLALPSAVDQRETRPKGSFRKFLNCFRPVQLDGDEYSSHAERPNNSYTFVNTHLHHSVVDIVLNLLGLAVIINSLILILSSAVFHQPGAEASSADIFGAHALLRDIVGRGAAFIFAIGFLCAGQSASLVATVAGQIVSEGFLRWRVSPLVRRLLTRLLSLIPSVVVAVAVGRPGMNTMLVVSQVVLALVLPFIILPLVWLTSSRTVMRVRAPSPAPARAMHKDDSAEEDPTVGGEDVYLDYSNGWFTTSIGYIMLAVIVIANGYVLIMLMLGKGT